MLQLLRQKMYKMDNWTADREYLEEEFRRKLETQWSCDYENEQEDDYDFEDVIDEENDLK